MYNELLDLVLHPVRMRLVLALAKESLTSLQLSERLADVPQATLYRHINRLSQAGVIKVVEERPVRGVLEKVYAIDPGRTSLGPEALSELTKEDYMRLFLGFVATQLDEFGRYLESRAQPDMVADGVGFRKYPLELSDAEFVEFSRALGEVLRDFIGKPPAPDRKPRILSLTILPEVGGHQKD